ncbi:MAG TPA: hypothetical protein VK536_02835 [Candidatus Limnocylindrales bacterium]|nr:hypothetical protein [Candidatus Limnocylindrales bacterium]
MVENEDDTLYDEVEYPYFEEEKDLRDNEEGGEENTEWEEETDLTEIFDTPEEYEQFLLGNSPKCFARFNPTMFCVFGYFAEEPKYRQALGKLLPHRIGRILDKLGFVTEISYGQSNGVDIKARINGRLVLVIETKNLNITTKLPDEIIQNCIDNLQAHPYCRRYFIYTQMANTKSLDKFKEKGIRVLEIGYQLMPRWFYYSLVPSIRSYREIDTRYTTEDIRRKLFPMVLPILLENLDSLDVTIRV